MNLNKGFDGLTDNKGIASENPDMCQVKKPSLLAV